METTNYIPISEFRYFIIQENNKNAVAIISENEESVSYCNLTLIPYLNHLTGKIDYRLGTKPGAPIRLCPNPDFQDNVQKGIMRSLIDITKDPQEVERVLILNKTVRESTALLNS